MTGMNRMKKLVVAAVMGLAIVVQGMMPVISVKAAEAVPMVLETCKGCGTAVNVDVKRTDGARTWLYKCDDPSHKEAGMIDCNVYRVTVIVTTRYLCPKCEKSEVIGTSTEYKYIHVF